MLPSHWSIWLYKNEIPTKAVNSARAVIQLPWTEPSSFRSISYIARTDGTLPARTAHVDV